MAESGGGQDAPPSIKPQSQEVSSNITSDKPSGRWDFLKKPLKRLWDYPTDKNKRTILKGVAVMAGVGVIAGAGAELAEKSLSETTVDKIIKVGNTDMHLLAQEFGENDSEEAVFYLVGAPMRANASVSWEQPKQLAEKFGVKAYTLDARPMGQYEGDAADLEVQAIASYAEELTAKGVKKFTIMGHSVGAKKAIMLAALLEKNPNITVEGVLAANAVGLYPEDNVGILQDYIADGLNQPNLANPRAVHESLAKVIPNLVGSMVSDAKDTGRGYLHFLQDQMALATQLTPELATIKAPVVFLLAEGDKIVKLDKVLPPEEVAKKDAQIAERTAQPEISDDQLRKQFSESNKWENVLKNEEQQREIMKNSTQWSSLTSQEQADILRGMDSRTGFSSKEEFVEHYLIRYKNLQEMISLAKARKEYIKEKLPNSEHVGVIVATKYDSHIGFSVERPDAVADIGSKIFERFRRKSPEPTDEVALEPIPFSQAQQGEQQKAT